MTWKRAFAMFFAGAGFLAQVGMTWGADASRITQVHRTIEKVTSFAKSPSAVQLPKFVDERARVQEVYKVSWEAPSAGLAPGAVLLFDYKQAGQPGVKSLHIQYPFQVMGARTSTFVISDQAIRAGGPVTAWHVRLARGGRLLAESRSNSWK